MKKIIFIVCALTALIGAGVMPADAQLLWKVEKPGSEKTSYILGTHHFAPVGLLDSIKGLDEAFRVVDKLYGELDMSAMRDPDAMLAMQRNLIAPADSTIDKIYTPAELDTIAGVWNKVTKGQVPFNALYPMKPAAVSTQMAVMMMMDKFPNINPAMPGIDETMQLRAKEAGKEVAGLESVDFQTEMLYGQPISKQKEALLEATRDGGEKEIETALLITDAYMARDIDKIGSIMTDTDSAKADDNERLVFSRNDNWTKILVDEMPQRSLMVVVGAGHLPMERGLIAQLRKAGFTVTPVD